MRRYFPILLVIVALAARLIPGLRTIDDSFITYRYARNILAGNGFVYNQGERILGTTTPLYTLILTLTAIPFGGRDAPFPLISAVLNACFDAISCVLLYQLGQRFHFDLAGAITALVWSIAPYSVTFAIGGLETSLYILLLLSMIFLYVQGKYIPAWFMAALALLTRPDALILIGLVGLHRLFLLIKKVKLSIWEPILFIVPVGVWCMFAFMYFGSPLPHSMLAKTLAYHLDSSAAFIRLLQHFATPFMEETTFGPPIIIAGLILYPFLFIIGARTLVRKNPSILPAAIYPWFYLIVFSIANPLIFRWYLTPPLPFYFFFILVGIEQILNEVLLPTLSKSILNSQEQSIWINKIPQLVLFGFPLIMSLLAWTIRPDHGPATPAPQMAWIKLETIYHQAASILQPVLKPGSVIAAGDVGVLGYDTGARILDTVGLNSRESTHYYPLDRNSYVINYAIPARLILDENPAFVVFLEVYGRKTLLQNDQFLKEYRMIEKIPTDIYGSDGMLLYQRK